MEFNVVFVDTIFNRGECTPKAERKKDALIARLIREDKRLSEVEENATSLALQIQTLNLKKPGRRKPERYEKDPNERKAENNKKIAELKKRTKCSLCREKGHWVRECPKKAEEGKSNKNFQQKTGSNAYVSDVTAFYLSTTECDKEVWLADSGARMHMTFREDYFTFLEPLNQEHFVKIADDKMLSAIGIGKIMIREEIDGTLLEREMQNVLLVPELKRNLFSIGTINDKKFSYHSYEAHCEIRDCDGKLTSRGARHGKLFRMLFEVIKPVQCNVARLDKNGQKDMVKLWHERLGHVNIRALIKTSELFGDKNFVIEEKGKFFL